MATADGGLPGVQQRQSVPVDGAQLSGRAPYPSVKGRGSLLREADCVLVAEGSVHWLRRG